MSETDGDFDGQSDENDSPGGDQTVIRQLEAKNKELESRIGDLVRTVGQEKQEKAKIESDYKAWGENLVAYYQEESEKLRRVIAELENQLVEELPDDGAKRVLQQRNEREREEEERRAARQREQQSYATQLEAAKRNAIATFGLEADDLQGVTDINQVWAVAGGISRRKIAEEMRNEFQKAPTDEEKREAEVDEERRNARTPGNGTPPPRETREERRPSGLEAELEEARKEYAHWQSARKLDKAMNAKKRVMALERQLAN
jgi:hypothetical protein